jgi:hypothetical protein
LMASERFVHSSTTGPSCSLEIITGELPASWGAHGQGRYVDWQADGACKVAGGERRWSKQAGGWAAALTDGRELVNGDVLLVEALNNFGILRRLGLDVEERKRSSPAALGGSSTSVQGAGSPRRAATCTRWQAQRGRSSPTAEPSHFVGVAHSGGGLTSKWSGSDMSTYRSGIKCM